MDTIVFSTEFNSIGSFLVHLICGTVAGGLFVFLYWQWPAGQMRAMLVGAQRRPAVTFAAAAFLIPTFLFAIWAYFSYLTPFFSARLSGHEIVFEYRFPERVVSVPRSQVERVDKGSQRDQGPWTALIVHTKDGRTFESAPVKPQRFEELKNLLQRAP